ncbi:MAG TPA: aspartyl protease family protein, partial [Gemmatimonadaceae bacterium]|nr:aspartyl protease family protein [Gemmatimonadaceae bacterium]
ATLYATATDSLIRYRSRIALSGVLYAQEKWEQLATLPRDPRVYDTGLGPDRATIESWADLFRRLPPSTVTFDAQPSIVPLSRTALGTPLVPVTVNGRTRFFWLDTGSSFTMLSSDVATVAGVPALAEDSLEIVTTTGRVAARAAVIDSLRVGHVLFRHHPAMIVDANLLRLTVPGAPGESQVLAIDGIIGFDAIRRMDIEIDYGHGRVTMRPSGRRAGSAERNLFWIGYPVVRLRSPTGRSVHFGLDTGADETFATRTILEKVRAPRLIKDERRVEGLGGASTVRVEMIPETRLSLGSHTVRFRNLIVLPPRRTTFINLDGVLGTNAWTGAKVRIDMANGRVEIEGSR